MNRANSRTRWIQIGFFILLLVCVGQVGWWMLDQRIHSTELAERMSRDLESDLQAAQAMVELGIPASEVANTFETVTETGAELAVDPNVLAQLENENHRRLRRYVWEGSFFLVVLIAGMTVLARALHQEVVLRRRQQNFLAAVGHEFKSPLTGVRLAAETLALRDPPADRRQRLIRQILDELERLEGMIENLLDTARIEDGKSTFRAEPIELCGTIRDAVRAFEARAQSSGVMVQIDLEDEIFIETDRSALATVLRNLLDNAWKATRDKEGAQIKVRAYHGSNGVTMEVHDNGEGFAPEETDKLFEKFYRPGDEMRRGGQGSGLGLYIVRVLVKRSGGQIRAFSSGRTKGATFTVVWPAMKEASHSLPEREPV
ncbi:MAG: HAMP domain-containing histidine kinase [Gammaproteobacteria bacterium]|nr:HAMP domain-containing histidine kinase [Gammaproteobacteria bacterium]